MHMLRCTPQHSTPQHTHSTQTMLSDKIYIYLYFLSHSCLVSAVWLCNNAYSRPIAIVSTPARPFWLRISRLSDGICFRRHRNSDTRMFGIYQTWTLSTHTHDFACNLDNSQFSLTSSHAMLLYHRVSHENISYLYSLIPVATALFWFSHCNKKPSWLCAKPEIFCWFIFLLFYVRIDARILKVHLRATDKRRTFQSIRRCSE